MCVPDTGGRPLISSWQAVLAPLLLAGVLSSPVGAGGQEPLSNSSRPGPLIQLPTGASVRFRDLMGRPMMLHFFSGACRHCKDDDRLLRDLALNYLDFGVVLINVYPQPARKSLTVDDEALTLQVPTLTDPGGAFAQRYGQSQQAGTVFLDRTGRVVTRLRDGFTSQDALKSLRRILGTP